jgi:hypothetical protein
MNIKPDLMGLIMPSSTLRVSDNLGDELGATGGSRFSALNLYIPIGTRTESSREIKEVGS